VRRGDAVLVEWVEHTGAEQYTVSRVFKVDAQLMQLQIVANTQW
jgi:hypothetical protein